MKAKSTGPATPEEYLAAIDEPRKADMLRLHALIQKAAQKLPPAMVSGMIGYGSYHYKYASGREGDWPIIALANNKSYISVYVCASEKGEYVAERCKAELPKASIGKSCIRFKRVSDIDLKVLERIIKEGVRVMTAEPAKAAKAGQ
jgi:hypothetical protein